MPAFSLSFFVLGCVGGILPDILRVIRNHYNPDLPVYLKSVNFWLGVVLLVLLGGLTAWALGATSAKDALIFGFASPQIISQLVGSAMLKNDRTQMGQQPDGRVIKPWWSS